jgi:periplasmic protein TonB
MGLRMSHERAFALFIALSLHGGLLATAWRAVGHAPRLPEATPPTPVSILVQWLAPQTAAPAVANTPTTPASKASRVLQQKVAIASGPSPNAVSIESLDPAVMTSEPAPKTNAIEVIAPSPTSRLENTLPVSTNKTTMSTPPRLDASQTGNPAPVYPVASKRLGEQGRVVLRIHIQADGHVGEIQLAATSGYERLDESAIRAVKRWIYRPARQGDAAIAWWYQQPVTFTLENSNAN